MNRRSIHTCLLLCFAVAYAQGQGIKYIEVDGQLTDSIQFSDTVNVIRAAQSRLTDYWRSGHIFSGLDSLSPDTLFFHKGAQYSLQLDSLFIYDEYTDSMYLQPTKSEHNLWPTINQQIELYANDGHPFVTLSLKNIRHSSGWSSSVLLNPGPSVVFDSLALIEEVDVGRSYLKSVLGMQSGTPYSEQRFRQISRRLDRLPFVELNSEPDVTFYEGNATVYLDISESAQSSFEGVIGFLPNQSATNELILTGYLDLQLANLFQSGKALGLTWNRFADQSQVADIQYHHPYLLSTPLFASFHLNLLKQDTTFLNQTWSLETGTNLWSGSELFMAYERDRGSLINAAELNFEDGLADYKANMYQLGIRSSYFNIPFKFGRDLRYQLSGSVGEKAINVNPTIDSQVYDSIVLESSKLLISAGVRYQIPLAERLSLYHGLSGQLLFNEELLRNELFRLGGLKSLRGFNENFFYAKDYVLSRLELRQYFESSSYIMLFYDIAYMNTLTEESVPMGGGLGLSLNTSNGLFTFAAAVGGSQEIPVSFSNMKIHIGYVSKF